MVGPPSGAELAAPRAVFGGLGCTQIMQHYSQLTAGVGADYLAAVGSSLGAGDTAWDLTNLGV